MDLPDYTLLYYVYENNAQNTDSKYKKGERA